MDKVIGVMDKVIGSRIGSNIGSIFYSIFTFYLIIIYYEIYTPTHIHISYPNEILHQLVPSLCTCAKFVTVCDALPSINAVSIVSIVQLKLTLDLLIT